MFREGQEIGVYTLIRRIGRGGFGEVWLAERRTKFAVTQVAVKLPHDEQVDDEAIRQEAGIWARASGHANILPIIEANDYDGQIVIVSEYAPDGSLETLLKKRGGALRLKEAVEMTIEILNGLDFLHSRQIIHRDLKPANILLQGNTPRLADFGISRAMQTTSMSANIAGTPVYMSPEAFDGKRNKLTDIWSVGIILYQMLAGALPFSQNSHGELLAAIIMREAAPLPDSFPAQLRQIAKKALMKQPDERYQTAAVMRDDLMNFLATLSQSQPTVASKPEEPAVAQNTDEILTLIPKSAELTTQTRLRPVSSPLIVESPKPNRKYYAIPAVLALLLAFGGYLFLLSNKATGVRDGRESLSTAPPTANSTLAEQNNANSNVSTSANNSPDNFNSLDDIAERTAENRTSLDNNATEKSKSQSPEIRNGVTQIPANSREINEDSSKITKNKPIVERPRSDKNPITGKRNSEADTQEAEAKRKAEAEGTRRTLDRLIDRLNNNREQE